MSYATVSYILWIFAVVIVLIMLFACRPDNESRRYAIPKNTHRIVKLPLSVLVEEDEPKIDSDLPTSVMKSSEQMQLETTDLASTSLYISARTSFLPL